MTTLSKKKDMGYEKINKRHAQESMMKKRKKKLDYSLQDYHFKKKDMGYAKINKRHA